jgi:hypothetical protein
MPIIYIENLLNKKVDICRALFNAAAETDKGKNEKKQGIQTSANVPGLWMPLSDSDIEQALSSSRDTGYLLDIGYLQVKLEFKLNSVDTTYYEETYGISAKTVLEKAGFTCSDKPFSSSLPLSQLLSGLSVHDEKQKKAKKNMTKVEIGKGLANLLKVSSITLMYCSENSYEFCFADSEKSLSELEEYSKILSPLGFKVTISPAMVRGGDLILPASMGVRNTLDELSEKLEKLERNLNEKSKDMKPLVKK